MREVRGRRGLATAPHVRGLHDGAASGDVSNGKLLRPRSKGSAQSRPSTESPSALARPTRRHVLVVDSDHDFCSGLTTLLEASGMRATAVSDGHAGLSGARRLRPHLVVVEVMLPDLCGYEVCHQLRAEFGSELPIILVSGKRTEPCDRVAGLLIGADDYVVKPAALDELLTRIRALLSRARNNGRAGLTPRELEVLELLAEGLDQAEIASYLFISPKTVATHIDHILAKLGARSRAEAVARAYRERLVTA